MDYQIPTFVPNLQRSVGATATVFQTFYLLLLTLILSEIIFALSKGCLRMLLPEFPISSI